MLDPTGWEGRNIVGKEKSCCSCCKGYTVRKTFQNWKQGGRKRYYSFHDILEQMWQCITSSKDPTPNICRVNIVIKFHIFFWQDPMHCISQLWGSFEAEIIFSQLWGSWGWGRGLNGNRMTLYSLMLAQLTYVHTVDLSSQLIHMLTLDLCLQLTFALTIICLVFHCWLFIWLHAPTVRR